MEDLIHWLRTYLNMRHPAILFIRQMMILLWGYFPVWFVTLLLEHLCNS